MTIQINLKINLKIIIKCIKKWIVKNSIDTRFLLSVLYIIKCSRTDLSFLFFFFLSSDGVHSFSVFCSFALFIYCFLDYRFISCLRQSHLTDYWFLPYWSYSLSVSPLFLSFFLLVLLNFRVTTSQSKFPLASFFSPSFWISSPLFPATAPLLRFLLV